MSKSGDFDVPRGRSAGGRPKSSEFQFECGCFLYLKHAVETERVNSTAFVVRGLGMLKTSLHRDNP